MRFSLHTGLFLLFSAALLVTGCSKDKDDSSSSNTGGSGGVINTGGGNNPGGGGNNPGGQNATQLLCDKNYKLTAGTISPAFNGTTNYMQLLEPCELDDILRFNQNGTFTMDEGANVCPGNPQTSTGSWSLSQNNTVLTLNEDVGNSQFNVLTLDGTTLKLATQVQAQTGQVYDVTLTFTKQ